MRPTSFLWFLSSALLLVNAVPVLVDSSGLANVDESDSFVDPANVDRRRRDLDETTDLEKRQKKTKTKAAPKPVKAKPVKAKPTKAVVKPVKAKPTKASVKPTKAVVKPVKAKPTKASVKPVKAKPTTKASVKPTKATVKPTTKATVKPTKASVKPTKASVKPTKVSVKPLKAKPTTKASVKPTKATVKPTTKASVKPTKASVKPTKATAKPTTKATTKPTKTSSKPATGTGKSCPIKKGAPKKGARGFSLAKRAFFGANAPQKITITLGGKDFALTKAGDDIQGENGIVYLTSTGDFAKTNKAKAGSLTKEIRTTDEAGQLVAGGTDESCTNKIIAEWIITKKVSGKKITETSGFITAKAAGEAKCSEALAKARNAVKVAHKKFFAATDLNHADISQENVLFADNLATASLIDFGQVTAGPEVSDEELDDHLDTFFGDALLC